MAVNLVLVDTILENDPFHPEIVDSGTTVNIDENLTDGLKIAEIQGFDDTRLPPSGSYRIQAVNDWGGRFNIIQENGKWYLVALGGPSNFDYEDMDYGGVFDGITFYFRDSTDVNNTGTVLQQLLVDVLLKDVENEAPANTAPTNIRWASGGTVAENAGTDDTVGTIVADDDGGTSGLRYSIADNANFGIDATTGRIYVKAGANLNYEAQQSYTVTVTATDTNGTGLSTPQNVTITLGDVNEAATDLTFSNEQTVQAGTTGANANVALATAVDPDTQNAAFRNNKYAFLVNGNLVTSDGKFSINETTGQITTNAAITAADVGTKNLQVVAYDAGNNALRYVETKAITIAAATNQAPSDPTAAVTINERSGNGTVVLTMAEADAEGQAINYTFAAAAPDTGGKTSLDGKFRIEGNKIVVNGTLSEVAQDTTLPNYAIIADDGTGAPNATVTGNVSITVKNVPLLSIRQITTGPVDEGDTGTVDYVFRVSRDEGSEASVRWTVSGEGIDADDFEVLSDIITFGANDSFQDIVLKVKADRIAELLETFTVTLSEAQGADIHSTQGSATGTITDDDHAPTFAITDGQGSHSGNVGNAIADVLKGVDIGDLDGDELTLTVSFLDAQGTLNGMVTGGGVTVTDNGVDGGSRRYTLVGSAAAIETLLAAVTFTSAVAGQTDFSFTLTDGANPVQTFANAVNAIATGTPNHAPANLDLNNRFVWEYTPPGPNTVIGTFSASDEDEGDHLTYTLLDSAGGRFTIVDNQLVLTGPGVNFEEARFHQILVRVSDGLDWFDQSFIINVGDQLTLNRRGKSKNDKMNGSDLDDILKGGSRTGKDVIKGLNGDDKLYGEGGNDTVYGGNGLDSLYGGSGNDTLKGDAGNDLVKGDAGNDKVYGGSGNDSVYGGSGNDTVKGDAGNDLVKGDSGTDKLYGGSGDDVVYGGSGNDTLKGDSGNDRLYGDSGNDVLYGGSGQDIFVFKHKPSKTSNKDTIKDFKVADDTIWLDNAVFKKLGKVGSEAAPAALNKDFFRIGSKAKDKNDYIVYDKKKGILYYDADGSGKGAAVEIAKLSKNLKMTYLDFMVI